MNVRAFGRDVVPCRPTPSAFGRGVWLPFDYFFGLEQQRDVAPNGSRGQAQNLRDCRRRDGSLLDDEIEHLLPSCGVCFFCHFSSAPARLPCACVCLSHGKSLR